MYAYQDWATPDPGNQEGNWLADTKPLPPPVSKQCRYQQAHHTHHTFDRRAVWHRPLGPTEGGYLSRASPAWLAQQANGQHGDKLSSIWIYAYLPTVTWDWTSGESIEPATRSTRRHALVIPRRLLIPLFLGSQQPRLGGAT